MAFKQYVREEVAAGLDETYQFESWSAQAPGSAYHDVHVSVIEEHETSVPTLRRVLAGRGQRILESGCGSGRWMAFFERLGHRPVGVDDSAAPLLVARAHAPAFNLVRADALVCPFKEATFDAVFSSYVAEHFEDGPGRLLDETHRVLKPGGALIIVVPFDNLFRRLITHRVLGIYYLVARWRGRPLAFTEHRFSHGEMERHLTRAGFCVEHVEPDDYRLPWAKGLCVDLGPIAAPRGAAIGSWELNRTALLLARALHAMSPWLCAAGIFYVARKAGPSECSTGLPRPLGHVS